MVAVRKGIVFSVSALLLFSVLLSLALTAQKDFWRPSFDALQAGRKVAYAWSDARADVFSALQLRVWRNASTVFLLDSLPASFNSSAALAGYDAFVSRVYRLPGNNVSFLPSLSELKPPVRVEPFGVAYDYPLRATGADAWEKNSLLAWCEDSGCGGVSVVAVNVSFNESFEYDPTNSSYQSFYSWSPAPANCVAGTPNCVVFSLRITDRLGRSFSCPSWGPGVSCPYSSFYWNSSSPAVLSVAVNESSSCFLNFSLGGNALFGESLRDSLNYSCGSINSVSGIAFNSSDFFLSVNSSLLVEAPEWSARVFSPVVVLERTS
ncbi:MAG: hypothetical protein ACP5O3_03505 [Candidatus Micrarchaeia archaeon]